MKNSIDRLEIEHRWNDKWNVAFFRDYNARGYYVSFERLMKIKAILNGQHWHIDNVWFGSQGMMVDYRYD